MKTNTRNLLASFLFMIAILLGVSAISPLTAFAIAAPDPTKIRAEKIYVGGVELGFGQYVRNGETTATTGEPAEDDYGYGFAWYDTYGTLVIAGYNYQGKGYEYSTGNYALVYSTGTLHVAVLGENTLKQTSGSNMGIYTVGALQIGNIGTLTIEGDNCSCLYSNNEIKFASDLGTVNLKSTGDACAIVSYDNDGDAVDEEAIIVNGGDIYVETFYTISDLTINYGAFKVSSPQYPLSEMPDINNYDGGYTITVSENEDGSEPVTYNQDNIATFNSDNLADYKYFRIAPPEKTVINSISVSGIDLPEIGESVVWGPEFPGSLTYGGEYMTVGYWIEKYTGTEWVDYSEDTDIIDHSVKYRYMLILRPNEGYNFPEDIGDQNVTINGEQGVVLETFPYNPFTTEVEVALEFTYPEPAIDYGITVADKDESDATVGVKITSQNCTDVLGNGTVSYESTTNTLTLNGYRYEGDGFVSHGRTCGIFVLPDFIDTLTIVLDGENEITLSTEGANGIVTTETDVVMKGSGSLKVNSHKMGVYSNGSDLEIQGGNITVVNALYPVEGYDFKMTGGTLTAETANGAYSTVIYANNDFIMTGGTITAAANGEEACAIYANNDFTMTDGDLKINTDYVGIGVYGSTLAIRGGTVEISTKEAGYAFARWDDTYEILFPLSIVESESNMTASVNADGSGAVTYDKEAYETYKYVKIELPHAHDYGTTWQSDENNHWNECECGDKANIAPHADENNDGKCDVCDYAMVTADEYTVTLYANDGLDTRNQIENVSGLYELPECTFTAPEGKQFKAWAIGSLEGEQKMPYEEIIITADTKIYAIWQDPPHACIAELKEGKDATCTENGWKDYYQCECGKYYEDENCTKLISDLETWKIGDGKIVVEHTYGDLILEDPAVHTQTELKAGMRAHYHCSVCDKYFDSSKNETTIVALTIPAPTHSFGDWVMDDEKHWKVCSCGLKSEENSHDYTDNSDMTCNTCGYDRTVPHTHGNGVLQSGQAATCTVNGWKDYYKCSCGKIYADAACTNEITSLEEWKNGNGKIVAEHTYGSLIPKVNATCSQAGTEAHYECSVCHTLFDEDKAVKIENELTIAIDGSAHEFGVWAPNGDGTHTRVCGTNGNHKETVACSGGKATCTEKAVCEVCNTAYGEALGHDAKDVWSTDGEYHWHECTRCEEQLDKVAHADENNDGKCDICGYAMGTPENPGGDKKPEKTGLSGGAIAGIAVGSVALAGLGGFAIFWFVIKKKKFADLITVFKKK